MTGVPQAIRQRLRDDEALRAWFEAHYPDAPLNTFVGLRPDEERGTGVPVDFFPYVAVSPLTEAKQPGADRVRTWRMSILFGLHDERVVEGESLGMTAIVDLSEVLLAALERQPLASPPPAVWTGEAEVRFDAGVGAPYYEAEIIIPVSVRP